MALFHSFLWLSRRRQWQPTPVLLPGKSHGQRSLVGCSPWVATSRTRLRNFTFTFHFHALEKEMATHPSVLAWRIPGTGEPGGLPSMGSRRVGHDWSDLAAAAERYICVYMCLWIFSHLCIYSSIQCLFSGQWLWLWETWREPVCPCFLVQSSISIKGLQPWSKLL